MSVRECSRYIAQESSTIEGFHLDIDKEHAGSACQPLHANNSFLLIAKNQI